MLVLANLFIYSFKLLLIGHVFEQSYLLYTYHIYMNECACAFARASRCKQCDNIA